MESELEFSAPLTGQPERARLLGEAAGALDRRASLMGPGGEQIETEEGRLARMFAEDRADLGRPEVFRLAPGGLDAARDGVPVTVEEQTRRNAHYWISLPVSLWTRATRGFNRVEVRVAFNDEEQDDARRPATVDALPDHALVARFEASAELSLAVGADLKFQAGLPEISLEAVGIPAAVQADASAEVGAETKLLLAPRKYSVRAARVARSGLGLGYVFWRLDSEAFVEENDPGLRVILRVPLPSEHLHITAEMVATRYPNLFGAGFRNAIRDLPSAMRDFFTGGTPITATGDWDLSEAL